MISFILIFMYIVCILDYVSCYQVTCDYRMDDKTMVIAHLWTKVVFNDYLNRCGEENAIVLMYRQCYIGDIMIPISDILDNYPSLKTLYWNCKGNCNVPDTYVDIIGCTPGNCNLIIILYHFRS